MKNKSRNSLFVLITLLAVGFAAVSTSLVINGTSLFGTNESDFEIIFTKSVIDGVDVSESTISEDGKSLTFTTSELAIKDEVSILNFVVANNSTQYDASVQMECIAEGENYNEYYKIEHTIPETIKASSKEKGSVTVTLLKTSVNEIEETFTCTIKANATERTEASEANRSEISVTAKDESNTDLNARAYEITGEDEEKLLDSLVKTGYVNDASEIDALIEVESDEFETIADTTFDVSSIASSGDTVVILHFDEEKQEWEYIGTETVDENGLVSGDFTSYSPVAFIVINEDGSYKNISSVKPGLYDENEELLCLWDECGIDVTIDYNSSSNEENYYRNTSTSGYYIITNNYPTTRKVVFPYDITRIGNASFRGITTIKSVIIPDNVEVIGESAFKDCTGLTDVKIGASVIDSWAFANCTNLNNVTLEDSVTSISTYVFYNCTSLKSIYIPISVIKISAAAYTVSPFSGCSSLKIYCGASEDQSGWSSYWNYYANGGKSLPVVYGVSRESYETNYR